MQCFLAPWSKGVIYHLSTLTQILLIAPRLLAHPSIHIHNEYSRVTHHQGTTHDDDNNNPLSHFNTPSPPGSSPPPFLSLSFFPTLVAIMTKMDNHTFFAILWLSIWGLDWYFQIHLVSKVFVVNVVRKVVSPFIFGLRMNNWGVTHLAMEN
jgi:hypothetical protein